MWTVTITGADDDVDPQDLADLSREFPFVDGPVGLKRASTKLIHGETLILPFNDGNNASRAAISSAESRFPPP